VTLRSRKLLKKATPCESSGALSAATRRWRARTRPPRSHRRERRAPDFLHGGAERLLHVLQLFPLGLAPVPVEAQHRVAVKRFRVVKDHQVELRIEAVNIFNHVNLGNPDSEIAVPGNNNANAGRINSTAYGNPDPQRNFHFALKYIF
jgi:hypothetical protein